MLSDSKLFSNKVFCLFFSDSCYMNMAARNVFAPFRVEEFSLDCKLKFNLSFIHIF